MSQLPVWTTPLMSLLWHSTRLTDCRDRHSSSGGCSGSPRNPSWARSWWKKISSGALSDFIQMLWKAFLETPDPALKRGWSSQIPFYWHIQGEVGIPSIPAAKFTSWCLSSSSQQSPTDTNQHLAGWTDSFLVQLMLQPYFAGILFEISKVQKHKLWKSIFLHFFRKWKTSLRWFMTT